MPDALHAVGTLFSNKKGEILLLLRKDNVREGNKWGLVGGQLKKGENKTDGALREINEEIGLELNPSGLIFIKTYEYLWKSGNKNIIFELFKCNLKKSVNLKLNKNEVAKHSWMKPKQAYKKKNLMIGLYEILRDLYKIESTN